MLMSEAVLKYARLKQVLIPGLLIVINAIFGLSVQAQDIPSYRSEAVKTGQADSTILAEGSFVPGQVTWFALEQKLADHWHVYWKNPGDSGLPLVMEWSLPDGYEAGAIDYPVPERIPVGPLVNFGFEGIPVFLVPVKAPVSAEPGENIDITIKAGWLICSDSCIPEDATFTISVLVTATPQKAENNFVQFDIGRGHLPEVFAGTTEFAATDGAIYLQAEIAEENATNVFFFPETEGVIFSSAEQPLVIEDNKITLTLKPDFNYNAATITSLPGVLSYETVGGALRAYALNPERNDDRVLKGLPSSALPDTAAPPGSGGVSANAGSATVASQQALSLPVLLIMAFLGGIILNVMPCVFPILFIKASSLMNSAHEDRATIVRHGWLYTIGVLATFAAIGGLLLVLRAQGERLGWGFHLQSPFIVLLSSYVLLLVGLNLAGVFHVGASVQGVGQGLTSKQGGWGSFFTGALAVLVAAPCIGPLLSAPMGAAVLLPPFWGMMIFLLMAFGLAFPYLLLSLVPGLGRMLPKPGAWMDVFKQLLSFPVFAAAAYFLWVMAAQTGPAGLATGLIGALLLAAAVWAFELSKSGGMRGWLVRGLALAMVLAAVIPARGITPVATTNITKEGASHGAIAGPVAFDQSKIAELNAQGQDVFVDFTAAWCVTCQFNKLTVFSSDDVARAFSDNNTQLMIADWTVRDEKITAALAAFDRNGVPLYVYYPADGNPRILTLPLTEQSVIKAVSG